MNEKPRLCHVFEAESGGVIESHAHQKRDRAGLRGTPLPVPPPSDLHVLATHPFLTAHRQYKKTGHIQLMSLGKSSQELP
jgi:hypothetical protein